MCLAPSLTGTKKTLFFKSKTGAKPVFFTFVPPPPPYTQVSHRVLFSQITMQIICFLLLGCIASHTPVALQITAPLQCIGGAGCIAFSLCFTMFCASLDQIQQVLRRGYKKVETVECDVSKEQQFRNLCAKFMKQPLEDGAQPHQQRLANQRKGQCRNRTRPLTGGSRPSTMGTLSLREQVWSDTRRGILAHLQNQLKVSPHTYTHFETHMF